MIERRIVALVLLTFGVGATVFAFVPPIPQWPEYHDFADRRAWLGIPNFCDVASNVTFSLIGLAGIRRLFSRKRPLVFHDPRERWVWLVFFLGLVFLGPASAAYHLAPDNAGLFWDRLMMSGVFMAWLSAHLTERLRCNPLGLLPVLLAVGAGAVFYWRVTESAGAGDLRAYGFVHFYPALLVPLLLAWFPPRYTRGKDSLLVLMLYGAALVAEGFDRPIFELTAVLSGHTLKHLLAAAAAGVVLYGLARRRPLGPTRPQPAQSTPSS